MLKTLAPLLALLCCTANVNSGFLLLDDFVEGSMDVSAGNAILDDSGQPVTDAHLRLGDLSTVVGGTRLLEIVDLTSVGTGEVSSRQVTQSVDPASGVQRVTATQMAEKIITGYGTRESPLNLDLSADTGVVVSFSRYSDDAPEDPDHLDLSLLSAFGGKLGSTSHVFELPANFRGGDVFLSFASFGDRLGLVDLTDVDVIGVEFIPSTGAYSYEIDRIAIVPEPNLVSGLGILLVSVLMSHLKRRHT